jgi:hypothetical protein
MKKLIVTLVILALLLASVPMAVYGASGGVTGSGKGGNTAPTVDAVTLVESGNDNEVTAMTPLTTYRVKVTASDINTINDIQEIEFHIYYSSDGSNWDADALGIFKWTKSGDVWSMENGGAITSWSVVGASCISPSVYTSTTGDWYLAFKPGKLAQAVVGQTWYASATAYDENKNGSGAWATGSSMSAYNEIALSASSITFGDNLTGIEPGATGYITDTGDNSITTEVLTNQQYAVSVYTTANWSDGGSNQIALSETIDLPPSGSGEFTLIIDDEEQGEPGDPKTKTQAVTTADTTVNGLGTLSRVSTNAGADEVTSDTPLYMALGFSLNGINEVDYSGTITFTITN